MYICIKAVTPVLTFDKSYQVGQEISETEYQNLEVRLRENFESTEPVVEPTDTSKGLEGTPEELPSTAGTLTGNPDAPDPIVLHLNGEIKE